MRLLAAQFESGQSGAAQVRDALASLFDGRIESIDLAVWAAILLGVVCGVLGCFIVLRRQSLLGDAVGHAVLPGVCFGFAAAGGRYMPALLAGALVAGVAATMLISLLGRTTTLKSGECMGVVFTGFYSLGIVKLVQIGHDPRYGASAGLESFLFGQITGISLNDVWLIGAVTAASLIAIVAAWRWLAVWSFDPGYAQSIGMPTRMIELGMTFMLTLAIVISIQAVGVVLVAALLVTPAATAYLLTDRLRRMALLSAGFGALSGVAGVLLSLGLSSPGRPAMPTGATIVVTAGLLFAMAFHFSPGHGVLPRVWRLWERRRRTRAENLLKTLHQIMENRGSGDPRFGISDVAHARHESPAQVRSHAKIAIKRGWLDAQSPDPLVLTDAGLAQARRLVRNHRLWELFLTREAHLAPDHVHADAEYIEHVLPPAVIAQLEALLEGAQADPHGKAIPPVSGATGVAS